MMKATSAQAQAWRSGWVLALVAALAFSSPAWAQTTGTLVGKVTDAHTGKPVTGALVIATSPRLQGEQTAVTDTDGHFTLSLLPPGRYKLAAQVQGYKPTERTALALQVDYTLRANLVVEPEVVTLEEQVITSRVAPAVNIGTAETGGVISREFLATVPTTRDYEGAILVTPTAFRDQGGISLGGSTSPENNYILDGFRVGDPGSNSLGTNLLTNFIDQVDVKTGGFMPEYGYSSGGIMNTVTKSGSNEFHGSIWGTLTPGLLTPASEVVGANGLAVASYASPYKGSYDTDFGLEVGGPILKDRLWFYAGFAAQLIYDVRTGFYRSRVPSQANPAVSEMDPYGLFVMQEIPGTTQIYGSGANDYTALAKLTWLVSENHNLFLSFITKPGNSFGRNRLDGSAPATTYAFDYNTTNVILGYGGKFLDKHLLVEANLGLYDSPFNPTPGIVDGVDQAQTPRIAWTTLQPIQNFVPSMATACPYESRQAGIGLAPGCYVQGYPTGGRGYMEQSTTSRLAGTASVTALFDLAGQHALKAGAQIDYTWYQATGRLSGGANYTAYGRYVGPGAPANGGSFNAFSMGSFGLVDPATAFQAPGGSTAYANFCSDIVDGQCVNPGGKDPTLGSSISVKSNNWANGYYLQDSWTIANVLTLNFGIRLDTQSMTDASATRTPYTPTYAVNDSWAPRVQAIWDFTGQGRGKVQANWGRYYESIPLQLAFASFATVGQVAGVYQLSSCSAEVTPGPTSTGNPAAACPNVYGLNVGQGPGPNTRNLGSSPLGVGPGFGQYLPFGAPVAPGIQGQYTDQFGGGVQYEILQDLTVGVDYLGRRQGAVVEDMSSSEGNDYFIANPGASQPWTATAGPYAGITYNPRWAASFDSTTGNIYTAAFPPPVRSYDAVTVSMNKLFSKRWLAQASYTWSSLRGNYSGLIRTDVGQFAPNLTTEYDLVSMLGNRSGPLGADHTHQVKAAGSYLVTLSESLSLTPGVNLSAISGAPVNAWGKHILYGNGDSFLVPRGMAGNLPWLATLDLSAKLSWALSGPYTLSFTLSVFNALNMQPATFVDNRYTFDFASPMQGAQCTSKNAVSQRDPLAAIVADCPDLIYARTLDGLRVSPNLNFGRATAYQTPVSARFGVTLSF